MANKDLFSGMGQSYSPLGQDDDDSLDGPKVGSLFDLNDTKPATSSNQNTFQGSQGASVDPFNFGSDNLMGAKPARPLGSGPLFDEDDILGVISSSDPMTRAAQQKAR